MAAIEALTRNAVNCEKCNQPWYGNVRFCPYCGCSAAPDQPLASGVATTDKLAPPTAPLSDIRAGKLTKQSIASTAPVVPAKSVSTSNSGLAKRKGEEKSDPPLTGDRHPVTGTAAAADGKTGRTAPVNVTLDTKKPARSPLRNIALAVAVIATSCVGYWLAIPGPVVSGKMDSADMQVQLHLSAVLRSAGAGDWVKADTEIKAMMMNANRPPQGDRKLAQEENAVGLKALRAKDYAEAIKFFGKAVAAEPGNVYWINNLGYAYLRNKNFAAAERYFKQALSFVPNHGISWQNLAEAYSENNNASDSKAALKLAIHFSTNRRKTLDLLAKTRSGSNEKFGPIIADVLTYAHSIPVASVK
jgi:hypothetical protein